jgi:hypothetical protein
LSRIFLAHSAGSIWTEWAVPGLRLKTVTASLHSVVGLRRVRRGNVFVSTRRRSKVCDGRVDVRGARVIFARASRAKSSTVRHKLDLGAVVAVCWDCEVGTPHCVLTEGAYERLDRLRYGAPCLLPA